MRVETYFGAVTRAIPFRKKLLEQKSSVTFPPRNTTGCSALIPKLGIAIISSQKKPARAFSVTGSHRRHPAGGLLWGRGRLDSRPLFSERRSTPKILLREVRVAPGSGL